MTRLGLFCIHLIVVITVIFADQYTKTLVLTIDPTAPIYITPFFNIVLAWNSGITFGMFNNGGALVFNVINWGTVVISVGLFIWMLREKFLAKSLPLALIIGGAIGNIMDRFRYGAVVDFLDFYVGAYHWPAFNLADSCIVVGVIMYLVASYMKDKHAKTF